MSDADQVDIRDLVERIEALEAENEELRKRVDELQSRAADLQLEATFPEPAWDDSSDDFYADAVVRVKNACRRSDEGPETTYDELTEVVRETANDHDASVDLGEATASVVGQLWRQGEIYEVDGDYRRV